MLANVHSLKLTPWMIPSMGFDKHIMVCFNYYGVIHNSFTALKHPLCFDWSFPSLSPWPPMIDLGAVS